MSIPLCVLPLTPSVSWRRGHQFQPVGESLPQLSRRVEPFWLVRRLLGGRIGLDRSLLDGSPARGSPPRGGNHGVLAYGSHAGHVQSLRNCLANRQSRPYYCRVALTWVTGGPYRVEPLVMASLPGSQACPGSRPASRRKTWRPSARRRSRMPSRKEVSTTVRPVRSNWPWWRRPTPGGVPQLPVSPGRRETEVAALVAEGTAKHVRQPPPAPRRPRGGLPLARPRHGLAVPSVP